MTNSLSTNAADAQLAWPEGAKSAVLLGFDLDGPTSARLQGDDIWRSARAFLEGGYGPFRGLPRLLRILRELELPATFFVPAWVVETWPDQCAGIVEGGHEVAGHGYRHENFFDLSTEQQHEALGRSQEVFRRYFGEPASGFRTPSGDWHQETSRILLEHGYRYSSSLRSDHQPFFHRLREPALDLVEIPARVDLDDYAYLAYTTQPPYPPAGDRIAGYATTMDNWRREFEGHYRVGGCLATVWHPKVSGTPGRALALRGLLEQAARPDDMWFATGTEIADWVRNHGVQSRLEGL